MKLSERWLAQYLSPLPEPERIAEDLTAMGIEVAGWSQLGSEWAPVELVEIVAAEAHPHADHLRVVEVARGDGTRTTVVTGAANALAGLRTWYAPPGTRLADGRTLGVAEFRGVRSPGMLCSASELGFQAGDGDLWPAPEALPLGTTLLEFLGGVDRVYDLELTPNLAGFDQSVRGIARELAARWDRSIQEQTPGSPGWPEAAGWVTVLDTAGAPFYQLLGFEVKAAAVAPLWMQRLLVAVGLRPINSLVDVTNYLCLDWGLPLHAFDRAKLDLPLTVRRARDGECLEALDGHTYRLDPEDVVIVDRQGPVALGGVIGGVRAAVSPETRDVLLEAASFDAGRVFRTMKRHQLHTEAAERSGRGVDAAALGPVLARAVALWQEVGADPRGMTLQCVGTVPPTNYLAWSPDAASSIVRLLGMDVENGVVESALRRLGFGIEDGRVRVPSWRRDVEGLHDLAEEVARVLGLDSVPARLPVLDVQRAEIPGVERRADVVRNLAVAAGYVEVVTPVFAKTTRGDAVAWGEGGVPARAVALRNPLRESEDGLRRSLVDSLLEVYSHNGAHAGALPRPIFEVAPVYHGGEAPDTAHEHMSVALLHPVHLPQSGWRGDAEATVFDVKGWAQWLAARMGWPWRERVVGPFPAAYHPGRSLWIVDDAGEPQGILGELVAEAEPRLRGARVLALEWRLPLAAPSELPPIPRVPRYPAVERDLSIIPWPGAGYRDLYTVLAEPRRWLEAVWLYDRFLMDEGPSLSFRFRFRSDTGTLTDDEVEVVMGEIVETVRRQSGIIRGL